jgi:hypothetical protein
MISNRYIQPKCSDFGGIQDVTGAQTINGRAGAGTSGGIGTVNKRKEVECPSEFLPLAMSIYAGTSYYTVL